MAEFTRFTNVAADCFSGPQLGAEVSFATDYALKAAEKQFIINAEATAASKTLTLGFQDGWCAIVTNVGNSNAFTLKNVAGDTGTSIGAGKAALIRASTTANGSTVTILTDGT